MSDMLKIARGLLVAFAIVGAIPAGAMADDAPDGYWRPPPVGTLLQSNEGESCRVIAVDDTSYVCKGDRSYWVQDVIWSVYRGLMQDTSSIDGSSITFDKREVDKLFPLEVGKTTTVNARTPSVRWKTKFKVTSFKRVETRLGERPVFAISYIDTAEDYKAKGWVYLDAEYGFYHAGKRLEVSQGNKEYNRRLFTLELPATNADN